MANPFLRGWGFADQMQNTAMQRNLGYLGGAINFQNMQQQAELAPLRKQLLEAQVAKATNPAPILKDMGGEIGVFNPRTFERIGTLQKTATPDALLREKGQTERHATPSGSAVLGAQTSVRGQDLSAETQRRGQDIGAETSRRGQELVDARSKEKLAQGKWQYDAARGGVVNVDTGEFRPATQDGQPIGPKPSENQQKELTSIEQQRSVIDGALKAVETTPGAFSFKRGVATMAGPITESAVGRLDSKNERETRSYVFNIVSKVINERAGAAQSAQELARLRSFLPAETDNASQIKDKLDGFKNYLGDLEKGTRRAAGGGLQRRATDDPLGLR